jgi:hypothetical protein
METCQIIRISGLEDGEEFQRDGLSKPQVVGAVDLSHPTFAHLSHNSVSPGKNGPGHEPLVCGFTGPDSRGDCWAL